MGKRLTKRWGKVGAIGFVVALIGALAQMEYFSPQNVTARRAKQALQNAQEASDAIYCLQHRAECDAIERRARLAERARE